MSGRSQQEELSEDMQSKARAAGGKRNQMSIKNHVRGNLKVSVVSKDLADEHHHQTSWFGKGCGPHWFCMCSVIFTRSMNNQALTIPNQRSMRLEDLLFQGFCILSSASKVPVWSPGLQDPQHHHAPVFDSFGNKFSIY